jgi:uncharacterized protein
MSLDHTAADERVVEAQLGRSLRAPWAVARRCHLGVPMVVENAPRLEGGEPFPTLFWLTCPLLRRRASRLEAEGAMAGLNRTSEQDPQLRARVRRAAARYRERRDAHEVIEEAGSLPGGGPERIKCLHAHLAHELAEPPNPVGARTLSAAGWPDCRSACVALGT